MSLDRQWTTQDTWNTDTDHRSQPSKMVTDGVADAEPVSKKRLLGEVPIVEALNENRNEKNINNTNESFMKISKTEYEEIKHRVSAIETRISKEFDKLQSSLINDSMDSVDMQDADHLNGPERVMDKYERTLEEIEMINSSPSTEQLANRLSRGLKIRRSAEQKVFRSPSQRKIGNIRRRSQENPRLSRNKSWHVGNNGIPASVPAAAVAAARLAMPTSKQVSGAAVASGSNADGTAAIAATDNGRQAATTSFYPSKITAKRNQASSMVASSTITSQQSNPSPPVLAALPLDDKTNNIPVVKSATSGGVDNATASNTATPKRGLDAQLQHEKWVCADIFFDDTSFQSPSTVTRRKRTRDPRASDTESENNTPNMTPRSANSVHISDSMKTPMLPPRLTSVKKTNGSQSVSRTPYPRPPTISKTHLTPLLQQDYHMQQGGRASIARLRSQNAGMVMAKAKLFDELGTDLRTTGGTKRRDDHQSGTTTRRSMAMVDPHTIGHAVRKTTPRKQSAGSVSPSGIQRRQNLRHLNYTPIKKSPLAMKQPALSCMQVDSPNIATPIPHIKRPLVTKSPRRLVRTPQSKRKAASPLRATTPFKYRNSPRLHAIN